MRHTTHIADWAYKEAYGAWEDVVNEVCSVRREVRWESVATAITVIEAIHKSEYPVRFNKIFGQESNVKLYSF